jgi:hypothetical protein
MQASGDADRERYYLTRLAFIDTCLKLHRFEDGKGVLQGLIQDVKNNLYPVERRRELGNYGWLLSAGSGDYDAGFDFYRAAKAALEGNSELPLVYQRLVVTLAERGRVDEAEVELKEWIAVDPRADQRMIQKLTDQINLARTRRTSVTGK